MSATDHDKDWKARALCAQTDPEAFFPEKGGSTVEAKKVCLACGVRTECLDYALRHDERFGVWGGMSAPERIRLRKGQATKHSTVTQVQRAERDKSILAMVDKGMQIPVIAAMLHISDQTVYRVLKRRRSTEHVRAAS